ncbi:hypothetical protein D9M72_379960 [compost metagenome]
MPRDFACRARYGPVAQALAQRVQQCRLRQHEAAADPGQAIELADRAQHHQAGLAAVRGHRAIGQAVDKGFIDQQRAAARRQRGMPAQQRGGGQHAASRVVRVHDDEMVKLVGQRRLREIRFIQRRHRMARGSEGRRVFAVAERGDANAARAQQTRQRADGGLRAGDGQGPRRAAGLCGQLGQSVVILRQPLPRLRRQRRHRIAVGIDASGQVEPVAGGAAVAAHRGKQVAAMSDRGQGGAHVGVATARTASALAPASASHSHKARSTSRRQAITCAACGAGPAPSGGRCSISP